MTELRKILHVEDDADIREIALLSLAEFGGFEVLQCASGEEALAQAGGFAADVILLDMMMPGMTGIETLAALRQLPGYETTPAIFMTAKDVQAEIADEIAALAAGAIQKPFDPVSLPDQVRDIAGRLG